MENTEPTEPTEAPRVGLPDPEPTEPNTEPTEPTARKGGVKQTPVEAHRLSTSAFFKASKGLPVVLVEHLGERPAAVRLVCAKVGDSVRVAKTFGGWGFLGKFIFRLNADCTEFQPRPEGETWEPV